MYDLRFGFVGLVCARLDLAERAGVMLLVVGSSVVRIWYGYGGRFGSMGYLETRTQYNQSIIKQNRLQGKVGISWLEECLSKMG